jgi:mRNA interferase MazF
MADSDARFDAFDIVVVPFPYSDRLAEKRRPALVVSNKRLKALGVIWVAMITSAENESWPDDVTIGDVARAGLPAPSIVRPAKIACIDPGRVLRRSGKLDKATARTVAQRVRRFLG